MARAFRTSSSLLTGLLFTALLTVACGGATPFPPPPPDGSDGPDPPPPYVPPPPTEPTISTGTYRVSLRSDGGLANGDSYVTDIGRDGRLVVFRSSATNLVDGDTNAVDDIFVHDRATRTTTRVSVASDGTEADAASAVEAADSAVLSPDGRYVAFVSHATNLVADDTNGVKDIFVHDRLLGITARVSVSAEDGQADGPSTAPRFSSDGRYVAFESQASNLGETEDGWFLHDLMTGHTVGLPHPAYHAVRFRGRYDIIRTWYPDEPSASIRDRVTGVVEPLDIEVEKLEGSVGQPTPDGRFMLVSPWYQLFVHDRELGTTVPVSVTPSGEFGNGFTHGGWVGADGNAVGFISLARDLTDDPPVGWSLYVRNLDTASTRRVPIDAGEAAMPDFHFAVMSDDGVHVAFSYRASFSDEFGGPAGVEGMAPHPHDVLEVFVHTFPSQGDEP